MMENQSQRNEVRHEIIEDGRRVDAGEGEAAVAFGHEDISQVVTGWRRTEVDSSDHFLSLCPVRFSVKRLKSPLF
jgi:hypothetical protein